MSNRPCCWRKTGRSDSSAPAGAGTPVNQSDVQAGAAADLSLTLKRASLRAQHEISAKLAIQPRAPALWSDQFCRMNAGAAPKQTTSESESSSAPNFETARTARATRPSRLSSSMAAMMVAVAPAASPDAVKLSEAKPQAKAPKVIADGNAPRTCSEIAILDKAQPPAERPSSAGFPGCSSQRRARSRAVV